MRYLKILRLELLPLLIQPLTFLIRNSIASFKGVKLHFWRMAILTIRLWTFRYSQFTTILPNRQIKYRPTIILLEDKTMILKRRNLLTMIKNTLSEI